MQPADFLFIRGKKPSLRDKKAVGGVYAAIFATIGALIAYSLTRPIDEQANAAARNSCGDAESVAGIEKLPTAKKKEQVEELGKTIEYLQKRCISGDANNAVERLEKVKAKWEASLPKGEQANVKPVKGEPVSDLRWKPKPQKQLPARAPQKIARSKC